MVLTPYERVKRWREKSKKNQEYKNIHRRRRKRELRRLLMEGKIKPQDVPQSYNIIRKLPTKQG